MILMTVEYSSMYENDPIIKCEYCKKRVTKWITILPCGNLCINCAQTTMRILFQNIIEYHNPECGHGVNLLEIMYHGSKDNEKHRLPENITPSGKKNEFVVKEG